MSRHLRRLVTASAMTMALLSFGPAGCGSDAGGSELIQVSTNEPGNFDVDFVGDGQSETSSWSWENPGEGEVVATYAMDITASNGGQVDVVVLDADGVEVAAFGLEVGVGDDSLDGISMRGAPGTWTININLTNFDGDGSLNLDGGDPDEV